MLSSHINLTAINQSDPSGIPNAHPMSMIARTDVTNPSTEDWVNVFDPDGYNVQPDTNLHRKMGRVHLPDVLKVASLFRFATRLSKSDNMPLCQSPVLTIMKGKLKITGFVTPQRVCVCVCVTLSKWR